MVIVTSISEYQNVTAYYDWNPVNSAKTHFSRLYYIRGGEAHYTDGITSFRFQPGHLYLLPSYKAYRLSHDPDDPLRHLYCHITTSPPITSVVDVEVETNSLLYQAISLLKNNIASDDSHIIIKMVDLIVALMFQAVSGTEAYISDSAHRIICLKKLTICLPSNTFLSSAWRRRSTICAPENP